VQILGASNIAAACADAGISRLVHVSAIGADAQSDSLYSSSKGAGEETVLKAVPTATIMRPSIIFGPEDDFFNRFASMSALSPILPLIGGGDTKFQPVYVDDVADAICASLEAREAMGQVYELGGPKVYNFKQLLEIMLNEIRVRRFLVPVPFFAANMMGLGGEIAGKFPFIDPFLTRDQVKLLKNDNVVSEGANGIEVFGIHPKTIEAILPSYMVRYRKYGQFSEETEQTV